VKRPRGFEPPDPLRAQSLGSHVNRSFKLRRGADTLAARCKYMGMAATLLCCACLFPRPASAYGVDARAPRFDHPELGVSMSVSPGGLFGLVGGSLIIAPLAWFVLEPGVAQRLDERPRPVGLVRARVARFRTVALSVGLGLDHQNRYEPETPHCLFSESECGRKARNVWGMPIQLMAELRMRSGATFGPHLGFKVPVAWDSCRRYENGDEVGGCTPLLMPYFGLTVSWSAQLGVRRPAQLANTAGTTP
jgi:hypothetical protein